MKRQFCPCLWYLAASVQHRDSTPNALISAINWITKMLIFFNNSPFAGPVAPSFEVKYSKRRGCHLDPTDVLKILLRSVQLTGSSRINAVATGWCEANSSLSLLWKVLKRDMLMVHSHSLLKFFLLFKNGLNAVLCCSHITLKRSKVPRTKIVTWWYVWTEPLVE